MIHITIRYLIFKYLASLLISYQHTSGEIYRLYCGVKIFRCLNYPSPLAFRRGVFGWSNSATQWMRGSNGRNWSLQLERTRIYKYKNITPNVRTFVNVLSVNTAYIWATVHQCFSEDTLAVKHNRHNKRQTSQWPLCNWLRLGGLCHQPLLLLAIRF